MRSKMKFMFYAMAILVQSFYVALSFPLDETIDLSERECKDNRDDCNWIANNHYDVSKYCWAHKNDAFIKDCPKYCGFCKVPAPAPAPAPVEGCEDTRSDCNWIVENTNSAEYCYQYRNDPEVRKCAKTCGFCKPPAPPKLQKCEDTSQYCSWIPKHYNDVTGYCKKHMRDSLVQQCTKTCELCEPPKPVPQPQILECEDTRNDCSWIGEHNSDVAAYCDRHRNDAFIKQCQKTCGFCKAPAPSKPYRCEDTNKHCSWIPNTNADFIGYCNKHRNDSFIKQCPKTCEFCEYPTTPQPKNCEDISNDCSWIADNYGDVIGYCRRHKDDVYIKSCRKTCGFCEPPVPPESYFCKDTSKDCKWIAEQHKDVLGFCRSHRNDNLVQQCLSTCELCKHPPLSQKCEDSRDDCSWIAKNYDDVTGYCRRHRNDSFIKECTKTCEFCKHPTTSSSKCEDINKNCWWINKNYLAQDYCRRHKDDEFIKECRKTCGFCKAPAPSVCGDTREDCSWITRNIDDVASYCERWKNDESVKECRKTCGFC
ncbi:extracellular matrix protein FRAS1-like isoform X2 [Actinia tenebrosa]|uniref:Extracellular matrix protein FRAS1-like isoform X2 n=1 Tax=Actinia tenebrosa TaxID=6105 RepID=A0A6P8J077_ACTTE|nr:extracellular matrix protein FRAS1-like isoform X2 [Actinia tenebrosa]